MICISVTPESRQLAKVDILNAARQCDLVEVCLDHLLKEPDIKDLLDGAKKPLLFSCRRPDDVGQWHGTEEERMLLLKQAIIAGPAYIELDEDMATKVPRFGKVLRVVSFSSKDRPLGDLDELFNQASTLKADVVKFMWPTQTLEAAWPLLHACTQKRAIPIVGQGIGRGGLTFSLLGRKYGSPWIYAALERGMEAYPGQPTVGDLDTIYRWRDIGPKTRFIGVLGFGPAERALCQAFNAGFDALQMQTRCLPLDFRDAAQAARMLDVLKIPAIAAIPSHGRTLCSLAQTQDEFSQTSQFCDLLVKKDETWGAHNFLWKIAVRRLEEALGRQSAEDRPLDRRNVMIVGTGGMAQALTAAVKRRQGLVSIVCPDDHEAQHMAEALDVRFVPNAQLYTTLADVLVFASSNLDVKGKPTPINPALLRPGMAVLDLSELPGDSFLTREARERSCKVVNPSDVWIDYLQSVFKALTGQELPLGLAKLGLAEG